MRVVRGRRLSLKVLEASSGTLAAIEKHGNHNQKFCAIEDWVLLYPDFQEVICMPGKSVSFKLNDYKEDLCKPYSQILFYLCLSSQFYHNSKKSNKIDYINVKNTSTRVDNGYNFLTTIDDVDHPFGLLNDRSSCSSIPSTEYNSTHSAFPTLDNNIHSIENYIDNEPSLTDKLENLQAFLKIAGTVELSVRQRKIWLDTLEKLQRLYREGVKPFTITFIGEVAQDGGGPLKEFFAALFDDVKKVFIAIR
ncbi:uncharacterized protein LOC130645783 [Hydractinia symbiolongicarpus]|uniref:uncharacterized protein LOC130645783 n=1 Tax=Hydractinia symbiolongicarpus TaxID=13093 RepID=UPI00254BEE02|nr:uncharacterized protein LOC130645783 [Hydractinia symbiolongicarpus]